MIFEEFFLKKKIDLAQFAVADPNLFAQFKSHYAQMSEKSFDHTKKYWFNKLRHQFPLSAEEEARLKEQFKGDKNTPLSEALAEIPAAEVTVTKSTGFKPKFKAPVVAVKNEVPSITEDTPEAAENPVGKPAGFKPRFKAGATAAAAKDELPPKQIAQPAADGADKVNQEQSVNKPAGFKPRFKAGATTVEKTEELPPKEIAKEEGTEVSKPPGFKPRFKAGATTVATKENKEELPPKQVEETRKAEENLKTDAGETIAKPVGFKPRFKAGATKVAHEEIKEELPPKHIEEPTTETPPEVKTETAKPVGFKPRFKAGATKVVNEESKEELPPKQIDKNG